MKKIVFIGKTNAGKSSIFNALLNEIVSVVDEKENMTIDVVMRQLNDVCLFDTPGIRKAVDIYEISKKISDIDLFCIIIPVGDKDKLYHDLIKVCSNIAQTVIIHSKIDLIHDVYLLEDKLHGLDHLYVSVFNKKSINDLSKYIGLHDEYKPNEDIAFYIFGRANVGKSTIANKLMGQERFVTRDEIGTTLEVNHDFLNINGVRYIISDTPGYRKNKDIDILAKVSQKMIENELSHEWHHKRVCCIVISAVDGLTRTDQKIIDQALHGFIIVIAINKKDMISDVVLQDVIDDVRNRYSAISLVAISAFCDEEIRKLKRTLLYASSIGEVKIKTSDFNKWLRSLNISCIKYGVHTGKMNFKLFVKKDPQNNEKIFIAKSFCRWFNLKGVRPAFEYIKS